MTEKLYTLIGPDGQDMLSAVPGTLGGNRRRKIYGRLGCRSAVGSLPTGYAKHRVFFAAEATAIAALNKLAELRTEERGDYECGKNCEYKDGMGDLRVCEATER